MHVVTTKRISSVSCDLRLMDRSIKDPTVQESNSNKLPSHNILLHCNLSPSKRELKPQQYKLKKRVANRSSSVQSSEGILRQNSKAFPPSYSSLSPAADPCEHKLNVSPHFYSGHNRDSIRHSDQHPMQFSQRKARTQSINQRIATSPILSSNAANLTTGLGCLPKAERVLVAPNSKAGSFIYKNEYKSLIASCDVSRTAHLQKSRDSVSSANSPSRLKQLLGSNPYKSLLKCINER
jgi:hypothetical protein